MAAQHLGNAKQEKNGSRGGDNTAGGEPADLGRTAFRGGNSQWIQEMRNDLI